MAGLWAQWKDSRAMAAALLMGMIAALVYLALRFDASTTVLRDCDQFWYAGWLWDHGLSAYGPASAANRKLAFGDWVTIPPLFYPPPFWAVSAPLGLFGRSAALVVGAVVNLACLVGGAWLWRGVARAWGQPAGLQAALLLIGAGVMTATGFALQIGQTSFLMWFAIAMVASGLVGKTRWRTVVGLSLLMIKPQFGIAFSFAFFCLYRDWRVVVGVVTLVAAASLPPLLIGGVAMIGDYLRPLGDYAGFTINRMDSMTGIAHLIAITTGHEMSPHPLMILAGLVAAAVGLLLVRRGGDRDRIYLSVTTICVALIVPLHNYDMFFALVIPAILLPPQRLAAAVPVIVGVALMLRPENIARIVGGPLWTPGVIGLFVIVGVLLAERYHSARGSSPMRSRIT